MCVERTSRLEAVCERHGVALRAAALRFPLALPAVEIVLVGARSAAAWQDAQATARQPIPPAFWHDLPDDVREIVLSNVKLHVARQRAHTNALNRDLESKLAQRGMVFIHPDTASFRARLAGGFYARWKDELGHTAWNLLEAGVGRLA